MPTAVLFDVFTDLRAPVAYLTVLVGGLALLLSVIYLGGRAIRPQTVRTRLRAGVAAAVILILLAAFDVYLAIASFPHL